MNPALVRSRAYVLAALVATLAFIGLATFSCGEPGLSAQSCIGKTAGC